MSFLLQLNEALSKKDQKALMKEWRELSIELTLFADIAKKMGARIGEIEKQLLPVVKEAENQTDVIDNAILEYKAAAGKKTVSYSELWNETLKVVNEDQKAVLEAYKTSIEKVGAGSEALKIVDPKMQKVLAAWNKNMTVPELKQMLVQLAKLPNDINLTEGSIIEAIKKALRLVMEAFVPVAQAQKVSKRSALKLAELSKAE